MEELLTNILSDYRNLLDNFYSSCDSLNHYSSQFKEFVSNNIYMITYDLPFVDGEPTTKIQSSSNCLEDPKELPGIYAEKRSILEELKRDMDNKAYQLEKFNSLHYSNIRNQEVAEAFKKDYDNFQFKYGMTRLNFNGAHMYKRAG